MGRLSVKRNAPSSFSLRRRRTRVSGPVRLRRAVADALSVQRQERRLLGPGSGHPFPPKKTVTLTYCEFNTVSVTGGVPLDWQFNLNNLYDPDQSYTGHQPMGFDQLAAIYNRYRVLRADWTLTIPPISQLGAAVMQVPSNIQGSIAAYDTYRIMEMPRCQFKGLSSVMPVTLTGSANLADICAVDETEYTTSDRTQAATTAAPDEHIVLHTVFYTPSTQTYRIMMSITYTAEFFDYNDLPSS